jgi:hypothetical protein
MLQCDAVVSLEHRGLAYAPFRSHHVAEKSLDGHAPRHAAPLAHHLLGLRLFSRDAGADEVHARVSVS